MQIRLLEIAQIELDDSIEYYNSESHGLGNELLVEVLHALERIKNFPKAWHPSLKLHAAVNFAVFHTGSYIRYWMLRFL